MKNNTTPDMFIFQLQYFRQENDIQWEAHTQETHISCPPEYYTLKIATLIAFLQYGPSTSHKQLQIPCLHVILPQVFRQFSYKLPEQLSLSFSTFTLSSLSVCWPCSRSNLKSCSLCCSSDCSCLSPFSFFCSATYRWLQAVIYSSASFTSNSPRPTYT